MSSEQHLHSCKHSRVCLATALFVLVLLLYWAMLSFGTFQLIGAEDRTQAYDSLGRNLIAGRADVDDSDINWEGTRINGKTYMYFGPFPAFVRIVTNYFLPQYWGNWGRVSSLLALMGTILFLGSLFNRATPDKSRQKWWMWSAIMCGFAFGSPLLLLASCAHIYHEAISWGVFWGTAALFFAIHFFENAAPKRDLFFLSLAAGAALLSRITFGIPWYLLLGYIFLRSVARVRRDGAASLLHTLLLMLPAAAGAAFQAWYNFARYGSVLTFVDYANFYVNPNSFGGAFNLLRLPSAFIDYLLPRPANFISSPPYLVMGQVSYLNDALFWEYKEPAIGLLLASPWLVVIGTVGIFLMLTRTQSLDRLMMVLCTAAEATAILSYYFVSQRYTPEFIPLFALGAYFCARMTNFSRASKLLSAPILMPLVFVSILVTFFTTLHFTHTYNASVPMEFRLAIREIFIPRVKLPAVPGTKIYLEDMDPVSLTFTHIEPVKKANAGGSPIIVAGWPHEHGVGMHAVTRSKYKVPEGARLFEALLCVSDTVTESDLPSIQFELRDGDGKTLFKSNVLTSTSEPVPVQIPLAGINEIEIILDDGGNGIDYDHGTLASAAFVVNEGPGAP